MLTFFPGLFKLEREAGVERMVFFGRVTPGFIEGNGVSSRLTLSFELHGGELGVNELGAAAGEGFGVGL